MISTIKKGDTVRIKRWHKSHIEHAEVINVDLLKQVAFCEHKGLDDGTPMHWGYPLIQLEVVETA